VGRSAAAWTPRPKVGGGVELTIRSKLLLVIMVLVAAFVVSVATYFTILAPVVEIRSEGQTLNELRTSLLNEAIEANRFFTARYSTQIEGYKKASEATSLAFARVKSLKLLPTVSASIKNSLDVIQNLRTLIDDNNTVFVRNLATLEADATKAFGFTDTFAILDLATDRQVRLGPYGDTAARHTKDLATQLTAVTSGLQTAVQVIDDQSVVISREIGSIERRSNLVSILIIASLSVAMIALALFLTSRIVGSIRSIEGSISVMIEGDLTGRFSVMTRDEIGKLSANLDRFVSSLNESIKDVQAASAENLRMKEHLIVTTEQTSSSARQIQANTASIDGQISTLDENLLSAGSAIQSIGESIRTLNGEIHEQLTMVEESTASVTEMIASIDNVAKIADRRQEAADKLVRTVSDGGIKIAETFETINRINESVDSIKAITGIIENISSETNLLAMNAAIEAAHAGDAGKGFSVVAGEIRKLATATSDNSREIGEILKVIVDGVSAASISGRAMNAGFREIDREVKDLQRSLEEIFASMKEVRSGGGQILQAMSALQEVSANVRSGSSSIDENSNQIGKTMSVVQRVSSEVRSGMAEISAGIGEITASVESVLATAQRLGELSESLDRGIVRFKTC